MIMITLAVTFSTASTNCFGEDTHHGPVAANGSLYFKAEPLNNYFNDVSDNIYYYIHLQGLDATPSENHVPLNLSVVLDKSGSMSGKKINYAKEALKYIINNLGEDDYLSIVLYDTDVEVLFSQQKLKNRQEVLKMVDEISSGSSTNLEGGIRKGYEQVKITKNIIEKEMINRVILLSDGLANVGITDSEQLSAITKGFFTEDHISISTFGVGADYNEDLMANIALQGGGKYYFIDSPEKLPEMFKDELNGISQVIAKNTKIEITFPYNDLVHEKTYAYNSTVNGNKLSISFNDIFASEQKSILIVFKKKRKLKDSMDISCVLTYANTMNDNQVNIVDGRSSTLKFAKDKQVYDGGFNKAASEGYAMEIAAEMYNDATFLCNQEHYKEAKQKTREAIEFLDKHFQLIGENTYLRELQDNLKEYEKMIDDMKKMDRVSFSLNLKRQKYRRFRTISCPAF